MKRAAALVVFVCLAAAPFVMDAAQKAPTKATTWEGTLVDVDCYLKDHTLTGNDHHGVKNCGTMCLRSGLPAGLLTKTNELHVLVARSLALAPYVGDQIRITGTMQDNLIVPQKAEVQTNGKWQAVNLTTMM